RYDAVVSLFHVMSYLIEDRDLEAAFHSAQRHLQANGAFTFDFWYGPAVLQAPPQPRVKTIQVGGNIIRRKTIPEWDRQRQIVRVNYNIEITNIANRETIRERERHVVRYYFPDEIHDRLAVCGFEVVHIGEWMTGKNPTDNTFSVYALTKVK